MVKIDLIVIGNIGCGKTSLVQSFVKGSDCFTHNYLPTLGANLEKKIIPYKDYKINICIWDTAGQEKFFSLTKAYFQKADGVLLVFDLTDLESFKRAEQYWLKQVEEYVPDSKRIILVGNKSDLDQVQLSTLLKQRKVKYVDVMELAQKYGMKYIETSARTGDAVDDAFEGLAKICADSVKSEVNEQVYVTLEQRQYKGCFEKFREQLSQFFGRTDKKQDNNQLLN